MRTMPLNQTYRRQVHTCRVTIERNTRIGDAYRLWEEFQCLNTGNKTSMWKKTSFKHEWRLVHIKLNAGYRALMTEDIVFNRSTAVWVLSQPDFRWVFRTLDLGFRCPSEAHIDCSEWHFPMGRGLVDGPFRRVLWQLLVKSRNFISRGLGWKNGKKVDVGSTTGTSPRHPSEIYAEQGKD